MEMLYLNWKYFTVAVDKDFYFEILLKTKSYIFND